MACQHHRGRRQHLNGPFGQRKLVVRRRAPKLAESWGRVGRTEVDLLGVGIGLESFGDTCRERHG